MAMFETQTNSGGGFLTKGDEFGGVRLRDQKDSCVIAEIHVTELGVFVETEADNHQLFKLAHQEIGEKKRARLGLVPGGEIYGAAKKLIAMRSWETGDVRAGNTGVEQSTSAAIGVPQADRAIAGSPLSYELTHPIGYVVGPIVQ